LKINYLIKFPTSTACRLSQMRDSRRLVIRTVACLETAASNARAESINADIQAAIARARGFRTFRNLRTVVYLCKAGLDLPASPYARA